MLKRTRHHAHVLNAKYHQQEAEIVSRPASAARSRSPPTWPAAAPTSSSGAGVRRRSAACTSSAPSATSRGASTASCAAAPGRQGDPGLVALLPVARGRPDAPVRQRAHLRPHAAHGRRGGRGHRAPLVTGAIARAQKRVEAHNFDIRKHLLEYDDVMNKQRTVVYDLRNKALVERGHAARTVLDVDRGARWPSASASSLGPRHPREEWNLKGLADELSFLLMRPVTRRRGAARPTAYEELEERAGAVGERGLPRARGASSAPRCCATLERHALPVYARRALARPPLRAGPSEGRHRPARLRPARSADRVQEGGVQAVRDAGREVHEDFVQRLFRVQIAPEAVRRDRAPAAAARRWSRSTPRRRGVRRRAPPRPRPRRERRPPPASPARPADCPRRRAAPARRAQRSVSVRQREEVQEVPHADRRRAWRP